MLVTAPIVDAGLAFLDSFGLPALFVLFVVKGAIIGKPFPTSVLLPGYILVVSASTWTIGLAIAAASAGYVVGQLLIYVLARQYGLELIQSVPFVSISEAQLDRADRLFGQYSGAGVFITNLVPYVGTFIVIPAGMASYPIGRLTVYATVSTVLNYVLIVFFVIESVDLVAAL